MRRRACWRRSRPSTPTRPSPCSWASRADQPLGATFSFLINSPTVSIGNLMLITSILGPGVAVAYTAVGLVIVIAGSDDICVCNLQERFDVSQSTPSHHLSLLVRAGLVRTSRRDKWIHYTADRKALRELSGGLAKLADATGEEGGRIK